MNRYMHSALAGALAVALGAAAPTLQAQSAKKQLERAGDGRQHTGTTFDGSRREQRRSGVDTTTAPNPVRAQPPTQSNTRQRAEQISREQSRIPRAQPPRTRPSAPPPSPSSNKAR